MRQIARASLWVLLVGGAVQGQQPATQLDNAAIAGTVVNGASGRPEAGVWVIAETKSLPTPFRKIVVTDDQGRFLVPELPAASYELWVRGYGLKDSTRTKAERGAQVKLQAADAATPREAARIYPASEWASLIRPPAQETLPAEYKTQEQWLAGLRGCNQCHQLGMPTSRILTRPEQWDALFRLNNGMNSAADRLGRQALIKALVDWTTRIGAGEVPKAPPRPAGIERNFVITQWDWAAPDSFIHDNVSTDKRNPTMYAYGNVYGADRTGGGRLWVLDPLEHTVKMLLVQPRVTRGFDRSIDYYHDRETGTWMASPHNPMLDEQGRVWMTQPVRPGSAADTPKWARQAIATETNDPAEIEIANQLVTSRGHGMQLGFFDSKTGKFQQVDTVYNTHHLQFDKQGRLWTNAPGDVVALGMLDTKKLDPNNPIATEAAAQKAWMRIDKATGKNVPGSGYATAVSPVDGSVWQSVPVANGPENKLIKFDPATSKFKDYLLPAPGRLSHGIDFSTDGVVWFSAGSGHLGRFDPKTEKFTFWQLPGPKYPGTGAETGSTEYPYFLWVDQFNASGLGQNTVIVTGTSSDSMLIFDPKAEKFSVVRMPYPMPFFTRGLDGRIDDARAGWKGRGLWASYNSYMPRFSETRMGYVTHIQLRPNPLAN